MHIMTWVLSAGEEFNQIFAISKLNYQKFEEVLKSHVKVIGEFTEPNQEAKLIFDNQEIIYPLKRFSGFEHFTKSI